MRQIWQMQLNFIEALLNNRIVKKMYEQPHAEMINANLHCMLGNESGEGEGASLDVEFEESAEKKVEE
jgi:hypothetical protein